MSRQLNIKWGARLRELREERKLSQRAVAKEADVPSPYYRRIERGEVGGRGVGDDVRIRIAAVFGVPVSDIWEYPEPSKADA